MVSMYTVDTRVSWNKDAMIYNNAEGDEFGDGCRWRRNVDPSTRRSSRAPRAHLPNRCL
jgi:hypothetical protein